MSLLFSTLFYISSFSLYFNRVILIMHKRSVIKRVPHRRTCFEAVVDFCPDEETGTVESRQSVVREVRGGQARVEDGSVL